MKKKLKAILKGDQSSGNVEVDRLKKALNAATLKFKKAKTARAEAKSAFFNAAEAWLSKAEMPVESVGKKAGKAAKAN